MLVLTGALAGGCDPATYTDQNFGSGLGADYMAPTGDGGDGTDAAPADGAAGTSGVAGTSGAAGSTGAGDTGT